MTYLSLEDIKHHLNLDEEFTADDEYIIALGESAEEATSIYIDVPLTQLEDENRQLPKGLIHAMYLLIGEWYAVREAANAASINVVPLAYEHLCDLYRNYTINKDE